MVVPALAGMAVLIILGVHPPDELTDLPASVSRAFSSVITAR
jgi:hypothetical protein